MTDTATAEFYGFCNRCHSFIEHGMHNGRSFTQLHEVWCEFEVTIVEGVVTAVKLTSMPTAEWMTKMRANGNRGPMPAEQAAREMRGSR